MKIVTRLQPSPAIATKDGPKDFDIRFDRERGWFAPIRLADWPHIFERFEQRRRQAYEQRNKATTVTEEGDSPT